MPGARRHSCLSVAIGSIRAARSAGTAPASTHETMMISRLVAYAAGSKTLMMVPTSAVSHRHENRRDRRSQGDASAQDRY